MIKNVIFDIGDILLQFDYANKDYNELTDEEKEIINTIIHSNYWSLIDYGFIDNDIISKVFCDMTNHKADDAINKFIYNWTNYGTISDEILNTLDILRNNGYHIYLLSNIDVNMHNRINEFNLIEHTDGYVFSYEVKQIKPYEDIYRNILTKYSLIDNECLFIDNNQDNIDTALRLGINAQKAIPGDFNDVIKILKSYNINIDR